MDIVSIIRQGGILSKEEQLKAVKKSGLYIEFIDNPDKDVQLEAVKSYSGSIKYIKEPDKEVIKYIQDKGELNGEHY